MMTKKTKKALCLLFATAMLLTTTACGAKPAPEIVPAETAVSAPEARADGMIDALEQEVTRMMNLSAQDFHMYGRDIRSADFSTMPETYDLRDSGFVGPVKHQGNWGTCWGFASASAAEISVLAELGIPYEDFARIFGEPMDLSEKHMAWFANSTLPLVEAYPQGEYPHPGLESQAGEGIRNPKEETEGTNARYNSGGYMAYATGLFSSGMGPVMESQHPYTANNGSSSTTADWSVPEEARFVMALELENSHILPSPAMEDENRNYVYNEYGTYAIKKELLQGRAVTIGYRGDRSMDPEAARNSTLDHLLSTGVPGTLEEFSTLLDYSSGKITAQEMTIEEKCFIIKFMLLTGSNMTEEEALATIAAMTEEEIETSFQPVQKESPEEVSDPEALAAEEAARLEEETHRRNMAEKLGFDYDKLQERIRLRTEANANVYINTDTYAQYTDTNLAMPNHAVTIIGWDDNYSAENFLEDKQPPADGAWIVRNSWGSSYGNAGYFYLSYYDQTITMPESYNFVTSYKAGIPTSMSILGMDYMATSSYPSIHMEDSCSYGNIFTLDPGQTVIRNISVLCGDLDTEVTANVYLLKEDAAHPADGILLDRVVQDLTYGGYYRIPLSHDFALPEGSRIGVVVTQRTAVGDKTEYAVPYAICTSQDYNTDINTLLPTDLQYSTFGIGHIGQGESWVCMDGQWYDWADVISDLQETCQLSHYFSFDNLGIKVYAYSLEELESLHDFEETLPYHGASMEICSDCSYSLIKP